MNVIVHVDEIFLKGKNQALFVKKLADNIRQLFKGSTVRRIEGGFLVKNLTEDDYKHFALLPGVAKFAPVMESRSSIECMKKTLNKLQISPTIKTFRISTNRANKKFNLNSNEINVELGNYIENKRGLKVNLKKYDINIRIDVGKDTTYIYDTVFEGAGGLPTGSSGKVLCMLSGGIDSPVAAYKLMTRGAEVSLIHFQSDTATKKESADKIMDIAKQLANFQPGINLHVVSFDSFQREIIMKVPAAYRMIINRRMMLKISELLSRKFSYQAIATGDSLGQVASQTLTNLSSIYSAVSTLKITPLIAYNKSEIIKIGRSIGTLDISNRPYPDCCSFMVAKHPKTAVKPNEVLALEANLSALDINNIKVISYHISIN